MRKQFRRIARKLLGKKSVERIMTSWQAPDLDTFEAFWANQDRWEPFRRPYWPRSVLFWVELSNEDNAEWSGRVFVTVGNPANAVDGNIKGVKLYITPFKPSRIVD